MTRTSSKDRRALANLTALSVAVLSLLLVSGLVAAQQGKDRRDDAAHLVQTTRLLNRSVKFVERERTGEITTLYIDPGTGLVPFGVLTFQAFFGIVDKACILSVPWPEVQFDSQTKLFFIREITTDEATCLTYNPDVHETIRASRAGKIFAYYGIENLLDRRRQRTDGDYQGQIYDLARLTNIPVCRQETRIGRAERYYMSLESGMVRMVLIHRDGEPKQDGNYLLVPFPLLQFDAAQVAYHLDLDTAALSKAPRFAHFDDAYLSREQVAEIYRSFGLEDYLE